MPSNPEMDLTRASGKELFNQWYDDAAQDWYTAAANVRDEIVRQARAQWEQERGTPLSDSEVADFVRKLLRARADMSADKLSDAEVLYQCSHTAVVVREVYARGQSSVIAACSDDVHADWFRKGHEAGVASAPAPDVRALQREAASEAIAYVYGQLDARPAVDKDIALAVLLNASRGKQGYLAATYDPAPPSVTLSEDRTVTLVNGMYQCRRAGTLLWQRINWHDIIADYRLTVEDAEALIGLEKQRAALAASHGGR